MSSFKALAALAALAALGTRAQEIAPEVLLLSRIRDHVRRELAHLPNYTCLETVQRFHKANGPKETMKAFDMVSLEVLYVDHKELYSSPGDRRFENDDPSKFIGSGMMGNGMFATFLRSLFENYQAVFTYHGEEEVAGHGSTRYDFRVPVMASAYKITVAGVSGTAGMKGSFWADPDTLDLLQLEIHADDIPYGLPVMEVNTTVTYGRVRVGAAEVMLPQTSILHMVGMTFDEERNFLEFTHCRAFEAESTLDFGTAAADAPKSAAPLNPRIKPGPMLPKGLDVTLALTTPITQQDTVGALIGAKVVGNVHYKGQVIVPDGARVNGRIRRLERNSGTSFFVVGLEFTGIEAGGALLGFYADLQNIDRTPGIERLLIGSNTKTADPANDARRYQTETETTFLSNLPGVGTFFVAGPRFHLPLGLKMVWKTRALAP
jgi:hypothetical protein